MTLELKLESRRAARDAARLALAGRFEQVRDDLEERGIGGRIVDKVTSNAAEAANEVAAVVRSNKSVLAGTVLALIAWVFRHPILALFRGDDADQFEPEHDDEKEWNT